MRGKANLVAGANIGSKKSGAFAKADMLPHFCTYAILLKFKLRQSWARLPIAAFPMRP